MTEKNIQKKLLSGSKQIVPMGPERQENPDCIINHVLLFNFFVLLLGIILIKRNIN